ncbi:MAG TPA: 3-deoxy-manno-octulosonate cytidylyltransferase [Gammaproteobacteria bacterium]
MTEGFIVVIPARYASTRLPGKPLKDIAGKPMIEWVYRQAQKSGASEVLVATDDERIVAACRAFEARVEMTSTEHASGTDRIAELARRFEWDDEQIVVNVQGDEPLISPACIAQTARLLAWRPQAAIATLVTPLESETEFRDPNLVKVVTDKDGWALYFSRAPIPWPRDGGMPAVMRHIGLYAYRAGSLRAISDASPCALEEVERLEQLRALWLGLRIIVGKAAEPPAPAVDTEEDLAKVRRFIEGEPARWPA